MKRMQSIYDDDDDDCYCSSKNAATQNTYTLLQPQQHLHLHLTTVFFAMPIPSSSLERRCCLSDDEEIVEDLILDKGMNNNKKKKMRGSSSSHCCSDHDATVDLTLADDDDYDDNDNESGVAALSFDQDDLATTRETASHSKKEGLLDMYWLNMPEQWSIKESDDGDGDKQVKITCPEEVDFWRHTLHGFVKDDGPFYWKFVYGDFEARLTVKGKFHYLYDMAGIMVRQNEDHWMTCGISNFQDNLQSRFHKHQTKHLYVSSTFTRGKSDWSTHRAMQKKPHKSSTFHVWVRRVGAVIECYYSLDNDLWIKVREGMLAPGVRKLRVGMMCTAPESAGFSVTFSNFMIRGGEKLPQDNIDNLVYKSNGASFVGMLEKREVEKRTEQGKQRMLKRVAEEKERNRSSRIAAKAPTQQHSSAHTRSFQTGTVYDSDDEHHSRMQTDAVAPTRRVIIALPARKSQSKAPTKHVVPASKPARETPKERPTNPYAVTPPPQPSHPQLTNQNHECQSTVDDHEASPPPVKKPMTNPYVNPPPQPTRKRSFPNKGPPFRERLQAASQSVSNPKNAHTPKGPIRNELSGKSLRRATVDEPTGRLSKLSDHLGNPLRKKSEIGRRRPSNQRRLPARSKSDTGPPRRRRTRPPKVCDDKGSPKRSKSWWSLNFSKETKDNKENPKRKFLNGMLRGKRPKKDTETSPITKRSDSSRQQTAPALQNDRPKRRSKNSRPSIPQRRPSDDIDAVSLRNEEELDSGDCPPVCPERQPSFDDNAPLAPSDDDNPVDKCLEEPKKREKEKKSKRDSSLDSTDGISGTTKKKKSIGKKVNKKYTNTVDFKKKKRKGDKNTERDEIEVVKVVE